MKSMTYGTLPPKAEWDAHWEKLDGQGELWHGRFHITLNEANGRAVEGFSLGDGDYTCDELWEAINEFVNSPSASDEAMDLVSGIMYCMQFEWV